MSIPAPPPYDVPPGPPTPPRRRRPSGWWFVVGGVLLVLAPLVFVGSLFTVLRPLTQEDAVFAVRETPVRVDLPPGEERALFSDRGVSADCSAVDGNGEPVEFRRVSGDFTYNEWTAVSRFDTGGGDLTFTCDSLDANSELRIARLPSTGSFVAGLVIGIAAPLGLGLLGLLVLLVTAVLFATGAPRQVPGR